ncbi:MAG: thioredoxin family protein [Saprospiraceae bacterium]|nr:thioredoxin family protein [Candidatus Vicinibacter affinis]
MKKLIMLMLLLSLSLTAFTQKGYKIGDVATDFSLKNINGKVVSMSDYKDAKGYIIIFTCNHCPYAKMYEKRIVELSAKYTDSGYPVIAINPNDPAVVPEDGPKEMKKIAKKHKYNFPYLFDEKQEVFPMYGATKTPHVFLLDKNRVVKYIGAIDDSPKDAAMVKEKYLENAIAALMNGKDPDPSITKAIGCSIKVKS